MGRTRITQVALAVAAVGSAATAGVAGAGTVQFQLGEQDFADGRAPVLSSEIRSAGAGEQYPFDGSIFGHDMETSLGAFEYAHAFDLRGATARAATLTIGLIDIDSPPDAPLDTVGLTLDGVAQPDGLLAGLSALGSPSSAEVVSITVPVEMLADGSLKVGVFAKRPGAGNLGNAIEADFSRLVVETDPAEFDPPLNSTDPPPPTSGGGDDGGDGGGGGSDGEPVIIPVPVALWPAGILLAALATAPKRIVSMLLRD